jgi:hypothetical protein
MEVMSWKRMAVIAGGESWLLKRFLPYSTGCLHLHILRWTDDFSICTCSCNPINSPISTPCWSLLWLHSFLWLRSFQLVEYVHCELSVLFLVVDLLYIIGWRVWLPEWTQIAWYLSTFFVMEKDLWRKTDCIIQILMRVNRVLRCIFNNLFVLDCIIGFWSFQLLIVSMTWMIRL